MAGPRGAGRGDSRRQELLDTAARLFCERGFHATSLREIAAAVGMLPGSIYYHFPSKDELLLAVYGEGVGRIAGRVDRAVAGESDPWRRLERAAAAHLEALFDASAYAQVVIRVRPGDVRALAARMVELRDAYEERFRRLVAALPLAAAVDPAYLRLMLLGALNWSQVWYRPGGETPGAIAHRFVALLRGAAAPGGRAR